MTSTVTITLAQDAQGNITASTDLAKPSVGAPLSPVQATALAIVNHLRANKTQVQHGAQHVPALSFALDMLSPEQHGWLVPTHIRRHAFGVISNSQ